MVNKPTKLSDVFMIVGGMVVVFCALLGIAVIVIEITLEEYDPPPQHLCHPGKSITCNPQTYYKIVETIPYGEFNETLLSPFDSTKDSWIKMIQSANTTIQIACSYMTLNITEEFVTDPWTTWGHDVGLQIYNLLIDAHKRGVKIQIVENEPISPDSANLQAMGVADVKVVNLTNILGAGILHAKFFVVDNSTFYLGSANMDWRSLTQVKELGIVVTGSHCLSTDLLQIFNLYWELGIESVVPTSEKEVSIVSEVFIPECNSIQRVEQYSITNITTWPFIYQAFFNASNPAIVDLILNGGAPSAANDTSAPSPGTYLTSSPQALCGPFRTSDLSATLDLINSEQERLRISVMDYAPITFYSPSTVYWPVIDNALRAAAIDRDVKVDLLISLWNYTSADVGQYLESLNVLDDITVKYFVIPDLPGVTIPYSRVNHAKYFVTSHGASISTSNWSADYFLSTGGVSYVTNDTEIISQLQWVFDRDWNSEYAFPITSTQCK